MNGYECVCPGEWEGERCESEVNECAPSPCQNGANCTVSSKILRDNLKI